MSDTLTLAERIEGCLVGSAIGAELALSRWTAPGAWERGNANEAPRARGKPRGALDDAPHRTDRFRLAPFVSLGVEAYLEARGRATPETFARILVDHPGAAAPAFFLDPVHTVQELLAEGMNPRLSGHGVGPCGVIGACMPAVGVFHLADPEAAYLDGVELASVAQGRLGADWAALAATAVAAAFEPGATNGSVTSRVLAIAFDNAREVFYDMNQLARESSMRGDEAAWITWWSERGCKAGADRRLNWAQPNPVMYLLPALQRFDDAPRVFGSLLAVHPEGLAEWSGGGHAVSAVIGGAVLGALRGTSAFDDEQVAWVRDTVAPWLEIGSVVENRLATERALCAEAAGSPAADDSATRDCLRHKIHGNLLASAIGNAMGSPVEGMLYSEIDARWPDGIDTLLEPHRLETEDDNQLAMLLVDTYVARAGLPVMARHFGDTWLERFNRDHYHPLCMGHSYDLIRAGWDPRITGHWATVTGSTVMCMESVGVFNAGDPSSAYQEALAISYMYQRGLDVVVAADMAAAVAEAMRPTATVDSVCDVALEMAPTTELRTFDRRPFANVREYLQLCLDVASRHTDCRQARQELYDRCLLYHHIDPLELWGLSLAMLKISGGDVREAAIGGTIIGRDSDTIAGRAAMLAGTLGGASAVPPEWVALVPDRALRRIETSATRLADVISGPLCERRARRQEVRAASGPPS